MILLFKDFNTDYWINNKILDCGVSCTNQVLHIDDLELPDDELIFLEEPNVKTGNIKKMNNDKKSKITNSRHKFGGITSKYKETDFRINNIQDTYTSKHICIHTGVYSHNYKRKV